MWTTGEIISTIIGSLFLFGGLLMLGQGFANIAHITRVFGEEFLVYADTGTYSIGRQAFKIREIKRDSIFFLVGALGVFSRSLWNHDWSLAWLIGILAGAGCARLSGQMVPGSILVLGRSEVNTLTLQVHLNECLPPFRAISLLQTQFRDDEIRVKAHCFRVGAGDDWIEAVETLCAFLPIVILDLRDSTEYVEEEVRIVLQKGYTFKTIFITLRGQREPILQRAVEMNSQLMTESIVCVADDAQCTDILGKLLVKEGKVPTRVRPLWKLIESYPSIELQ